MACKDGNSVRQKIISNVISSGIEKIVIMIIQLIATILIIRLLPRDDYGIIGIIVSYYAFINILNISLESSIVRDHNKYTHKTHEILNNFVMFNLLKGAIFIIIALIASIVFYYAYQNNSFVFAIWSITFLTIADSLVAPFMIYATSKFNQKLVTKISIFRYTLSLLLLLGLFIYPYVWFIAIKDFIVSVVFISIWFYVVFVKYDFKLIFKKVDYISMKESFMTYSLWSHLIGIVANILYRADTIFLSFFVSLYSIGQYNIGLNAANYANLIPSIINYQNSVALSNTSSEKEAKKITNYFLLSSIAIGIITIAGYWLFGDFLIYILTGEYDSEIFTYMMWIVTSVVIIKTFGAPFVAYISIKGSIKDFFMICSLPVLILSLVSSIIYIAYEGISGLLKMKNLVAIVIILLSYSLYKKTKSKNDK